MGVQNRRKQKRPLPLACYRLSVNCVNLNDFSLQPLAFENQVPQERESPATLCDARTMNEESRIKMKTGSQQPGPSAPADACPRPSAFAVGDCWRLLAIVGDCWRYFFTNQRTGRLSNPRKPNTKEIVRLNSPVFKKYFMGTRKHDRGGRISIYCKRPQGRSADCPVCCIAGCQTRRSHNHPAWLSRPRPAD
jgi:hypothetical protein